MIRRIAWGGRLWVALVIALVPALRSAAASPPAAGTRAHGPLADDTLRLRHAGTVTSSRAALPVGATIGGFLSAWGLPPVQGGFVVTEAALVFRPADGSAETSFPLVGPVRKVGGRARRASTVSLVYVTGGHGVASYLFRVDGGVFETDAPGPLLELAEHPEWLDSLRSIEWSADRPLVRPGDTAAAWATVRRAATSAYADSLYALFGRPRAAPGLVGVKGRRLGRLGEYVAARDSLALDPARMTTEAQLRHALAHELAHRWQARATVQLALLWRDLPPIRDPKRYGYGSVSEHQAEAIAFAVSFLQTTARAPAGSAPQLLTLLEHYESLVPGTRLLARYFSLQPTYAGHPLRVVLTTDPQRIASAGARPQ